MVLWGMYVGYWWLGLVFGRGEIPASSKDGFKDLITRTSDLLLGARGEFVFSLLRFEGALSMVVTEEKWDFALHTHLQRCGDHVGA